jgi:hypothetical protein
MKSAQSAAVEDKIVSLHENASVPDISYIDLPPSLKINNEALKRMDALSAAFGYPDTTISDVYRIAGLCQKAAEHYRTEAERIRDSKRLGREIERHPADSRVVQMKWHQRLKDDVILGRTIAVRGPAGNGKSTGVRSVLEELGYTVYQIDCTDTTTPEQLVGGLVPEPDGKGGIRMAFKAGLFAKAFSDPKGAIQLDEFDALDPRAAMCLQSALHRSLDGAGRWAAIPDHNDGGVRAEGSCPVVVTMNTYGSGATREYVGRNALDAASMDRFDSLIDTGYEQEELVIKAAGFTQAPVEKIVMFAKKIREMIDKNQLRVVLSTRRLLGIAEAMEKFGCQPKEAFEREFYSRLEKHDRESLFIDINGKTEIKPSATDFVPFESVITGDVSRFYQELNRRYQVEISHYIGRP